MGELIGNEIYIKAKVDPKIREELIAKSRSRIYKITCQITGRPLSWENDDELSIGLIAFNEAIDTFQPERGKNFWGYANLVIRNRLIDHFRQEANWKEKTLYKKDGDDISHKVSKQEAREAFQRMRQEETDLERAEKVILFEKTLGEYNITLKDLVKHSPKHQDTRVNLLNIAKVAVAEKEILEKVLRTKQLPIKELMLLTGQSRKVLERGRRYLIALIIILSQPQFLFIKEFLEPLKEVE